LTETTVVLVDARNVLRSRWPNVPEAELVRCAADWAAERGVKVVLVFDGRAPDVAVDPSCAVVGTGAESADDWIARAASEYEDSGQRFWLVTSDRALRAAAGAAAERIIGGGAHLTELGLR
jgi:predicted RNA-binding protein with PIN domain